MAAAASGFEGIRQVTVGDIPGAAATLDLFADGEGTTARLRLPYHALRRAA